MAMTREDVEAFVVRWAQAWNDRSVETVLDHFHEDIVFTSPTALAVVGSATVRGKAALRAYWLAALRQIGSLRFSVDHVLWDPIRREVAIIYTLKVDGHTKSVSENLRFNESGQVVGAEVFHGVLRQA
ncbi:nuclear transport factor 2 family protein [Nitrospira sp. NS4]|uniref:nuclear transport factor 2 family protein n=1 Tax=Nitrospira sp. NS4 TaxID=3414498 RepID=UPI003C2DAFA8